MRDLFSQPAAVMNVEMQDIPAPAAANGALTADQALHGHHIPPQQQLLLYSDKQWEGFVQEWAHYCLKAVYLQVQRFGGAGDRGIDIAGYTDTEKLIGVWDNYQCKHDDHALYPGDALPEIGKLLWYCFKKEFTTNRRPYVKGIIPAVSMQSDHLLVARRCARRATARNNSVTM